MPIPHNCFWGAAVPQFSSHPGADSAELRTICRSRCSLQGGSTDAHSGIIRSWAHPLYGAVFPPRPIQRIEYRILASAGEPSLFPETIQRRKASEAHSAEITPGERERYSGTTQVKHIPLRSTPGSENTTAERKLLGKIRCIRSRPRAGKPRDTKKNAEGNAQIRKKGQKKKGLRNEQSPPIFNYFTAVMCGLAPSYQYRKPSRSTVSPTFRADTAL